MSQISPWHWAGFCSGAIMMGYLVLGFLFLKFWKATRDRFFGYFAAGFWLLMIERIVMEAMDPLDERRPYIFALRLAAFICILIGIVDKNRRPT